MTTELARAAPARANEEEAAILRRLRVAPATGDRLRAELGLSQEDFERIAGALWDAYALRGEVEDGCCNDPCGPRCVAAMRMARRWRLTKKGEASVEGASRAGASTA